MGYVPLGMAFGLMAVKSGIDWQYALMMSVFIYAGSAQFLSVTLLAVQTPFFAIFIAIFLLNLRHFFYGLSMINDFKPLKGAAKKYAIFALTDETFALLKTLDVPKQDKTKTFLLITFLNQTYWVIGTLMGAFLGENLAFNAKGIEFCLTALFVVLGIELYKKERASTPLVISLAIGFLAIWLFPASNMLVISLLLCVSSLVLFRKRIEK
jgi:4-azaleucine resistance transporter AzlC